MVEAEHLVEKRAVGGAQVRRQRAIRQQRIGRGAQGLLLRLGTLEFKRAGAAGDKCAQAQFTQGVAKAVRRARGNAEQQIEDGPAQGRFAGLVGADDQMEVTAGQREFDAAPGKLAELEKIETLESRGRLNPRRRCGP